MSVAFVAPLGAMSTPVNSRLTYPVRPFAASFAGSGRQQNLIFTKSERPVVEPWCG
jgi:hypothetical protein